MALSLGKLTILVGAGIVGSILAKEGRLPSVSDVLSGALKVALKPTKENASASSASKPRNDALMAQVNSLRQELQLLASSRPVTIVTSHTTGGRRYGIIIVIVVLGYGYVRWKGWKIPGFMFATRRSLSDACKSVGKQLDDVFISLRVTRNDLSSKLDESSIKYDEIVASSSATKEEVTVVRRDVSKFAAEIQTVNNKIRTLETRMGTIKDKQDETKEGVAKLLLCTLDAENRFADLIQDAPGLSRPTIEHQQIPHPSRSVSLPLTLESSPSTSNGSIERGSVSEKSPVANRSSKGSQVSKTVENNFSPRVSNGNHCRITEVPENSPESQLPATQPSAKSAGLLSRTISATRHFKFL